MLATPNSLRRRRPYDTWSYHWSSFGKGKILAPRWCSYLPNTLDWRYALHAVSGVSHHSFLCFSHPSVQIFQPESSASTRPAGKIITSLSGFILLTVWKITTQDESNGFPLAPHHLVGIGNSQPASVVFLSMVSAGFRTIPAMDVVKIIQINLFSKSILFTPVDTIYRVGGPISSEKIG